MKYLISGIDYGNYGSVAMLNVALKHLTSAGVSRNEITELCHVPLNEIPGLEENTKSTKYFRLRDIIILLLLPKVFITNRLSKNLFDLSCQFSKQSKLFDISGFALSDKFTFGSWLRFMLPILLEFKRGGQIVVVPQSFGPFKGWKIRVFVSIFMAMSYSSRVKVFARDEDSISNLRSLGVKASLKYDTVLGLKSDMSGVRSKAKCDQAAIVSNSHLLKDVDLNELLIIYDCIARKLKNSVSKVIIFKHTLHDDNDLSTDIKNIFNRYEMDIDYLSEPLTFEELLELYPRLDLIVTSRFHSALLAMMHGVPCFILGWSKKYIELSRSFRQEEYCCSCKNFDEVKFQEFLLNRDKISKNLVEAAGEMIMRSQTELKEIYDEN